MAALRTFVNELLPLLSFWWRGGTIRTWDFTIWGLRDLKEAVAAAAAFGRLLSF
jgi:hypothetical protein